MDKIVSDESASRDVPVREHMHAQRIEWRIQQGGNWLLFAIVLIALLGGFSDGWLSETSATNPEKSLTVEYQRFLRAESDEPFALRIQGPKNQPVTVAFGGDFPDRFVLQTLQPQPVVTHTGQHSLTLTFAPTPDGAHAVWIVTQPQSAGRVSTTVTLAGASPVHLNQWVYP
ncbi:TPA: hypothetical protein JD203_18385 [Cronobacter sakazakii]|uniref:hypothetical protein n=2 Tax=Cronobacter sakazakii TaxID=28141 RepID=UPI0004A894FA|nr:hypothetical protein [Cronobacter sakazakii]EGT5207499.1 hypothetical protein [Cronobacter sakazakii]EGT5650898.1 hypothetical protein [Cronobacter sakazakii]EGT5748523.1 hypothetical protein [Cronobacter sakazakii]EGT5752824.1 hypothetical protein [Cronobacter sakazakii]EIZ2182790.1 hypothetical protein [Cronobacter sakazakii]